MHAPAAAFDGWLEAGSDLESEREGSTARGGEGGSGTRLREGETERD